MHISEGVLSAPTLIAGTGLAIIGLGIGLKKMEPQNIPQVAMLSSAFFVASLIHVPLGPANVHLVLNGLVGLLLGWTAVPAILVALLLQAVLFQFGGLATLGVNTVIMAAPALLVFLLFRRGAASGRQWIALASSFLAGAMAVLLGAVILAVSLAGSDISFLAAAKLAFAAHLPVMLIEGFITVFIVSFFRKVKPEMLGCLQV